LTKYLKYLISLFLAFGLMVNDGTLDSPSNAADYFQFSNLIISRESNHKGSKLYFFNQTNTSEKRAFLIPFNFLQLAASYSLTILVFFKFRTLIYQTISSFTMQRLFINEMITSRNSYTNLYIA
jgi:hypothetical protein